MSNKQFHCFSIRLAGYLMLKGCILFEIQENRDNRKKIYMFKDSEYLRKLVDDFMVNKDTLIK